MQDLVPRPEDLDPIERASVDELRALQLERLQWSLRHAYDNVPHYRAAFDAAGVHPDDCKDLADLARFPFTTKADLRENYPFGMFAVPREQVVRIHASSGTTGRPTVVGYTGEDIGDLGQRDGPLDPGRRRAAGTPGARRLRLRAVHRRARRALRRGEARLHGDPGVRRHDRAAGHADPGLPAGHHHGHPVLHAGDRRRDGARRASTRGARRCRSASSAPSRGPSEMRREIETAARHARRRHLRPVRGDGTGRRAGVRRDQGRPAHLGGPLLPRDRSTRSPARCCPTARRASSSSPR